MQIFGILCSRGDGVDASAGFFVVVKNADDAPGREEPPSVLYIRLNVQVVFSQEKSAELARRGRLGLSHVNQPQDIRVCTIKKVHPRSRSD